MSESMLIVDIKIGARFRKELGDIHTLAKSISEVGLLHPVVVSEDNELIAGVRRIEACKRLGWTEIPIHRVPLKDLVKGEFHENAVRKDFTASEMVAIGRVVEPEVKKEAEQREKAGKQIPSGKFPQGKSRDIVASFAGVSGRTYDKAEEIVAAAEKNPEKYGKILSSVDSDKISVNYAYQMVKRGEQQANPTALPEGEFNVIYADPPWQYELSLRGSVDEHYSSMTLDKICEMKVPAAEDAVLFLWATNPKLEEALQVMKAWGFQYKTNLVWVKDRIGTGYYFRGQHESLLLGVKGKPSTPLEADRPSSVLHAPRRKHSQKPEEVYSIIERMYPQGKYLELFAREAKREHWTMWGSENKTE